MAEGTCACGCAPAGGGSVDAGEERVNAGGVPTDGGRATIRLGDDRGAVTRRGVLTGSAAALAALALAACAGSDETGAESTSTPEGTPSAEGSTPAESPSESTPAEGAGGATGEVLASTTEFPVGGGKVVTVGGSVVVVTQPADGQFEAFNGKCPHAGCPVAEVTENTILCTCHGSTFDGSTGERLEGPAPRGLEPVAIAVEGDSIRLA